METILILSVLAGLLFEERYKRIASTKHLTERLIRAEDEITDLKTRLTELEGICVYKKLEDSRR